jgi:hypothetical protein
MKTFSVTFEDLSHLKSEELSDENMPLSGDTLLAQSYTVMLINSTDYVVKQARINGGQWFPTQHIGRTCNSTDYQNCASNNNYRPLLTVNCGSNAQIDVGWQKSDGSWWRTGWDTFYANCSNAGGIIQLI